MRWFFGGRESEYFKGIGGFLGIVRWLLWFVGVSLKLVFLVWFVFLFILVIFSCLGVGMKCRVRLGLGFW